MAPVPHESTVALELIEASARYEGSPVDALRGTSLSVRTGELVAILGPNGAGKSTLLRLLAGTLVPAYGEARLFGAPLLGRSRRDVARDLAFVAQTEEVRFAFTVREVVMMGRSPRQRGARASVEDDRLVDDALASCDLGALASRSVDQLSGGEKKRVGLARGFAQDARVMLLDEPTAFLDLRHQVALFEELVERVADATRACVVVTHDLQLAAAYASRVILMKAGRVLADGAPTEVLDAARLAAAFDCNIDAGRLEGTETRVFAPRRKSERPSTGVRP